MSVLTARTVLLVHAHPDDETLSTGVLAAELAARGARVVLLTATRGERGEVVPGPLSHLAGTDELVTRREAELAAAADVLGIAEQHWLGAGRARAAGLPERHYVDSGMRWVRPGLAGPADDAGADALTIAPLAEVAADVAALVAHVRPDVVVTYDAGGGYGHPDHVRVHEATVAASASAGVPVAEVLSEGPAAVAGADDGDVERLDLAAHLPTVVAALGKHASQLTVDGADVVHSGGQREAIRTAVALRVRRHRSP